MLSPKSRDRLMTCHPDLQRLISAVSDKTNIAVICGHRTEKEQQAAFNNKTTKVAWPNSKHNALPSQAVDIVPVPLDWQDKQGFIDMAKVVKETAKELGIKIKWGGDFKGFFDGPHFELEG